ncbi:MAG TPA: hypothetical protein VLG67_00375, partial [Candidatus Saccharimonadales bacterium]|nr:hypothetical protein [Candidatus Saccharimonadales bacterium]
MKKVILSLAFFILLVLSLPNGNLLSLILNPQVAHAGFLTQTTIRTDRQASLAQTTGLVCAQPAGAGVENSVEVSFPNSFSVSTTTSNWTVSTANLPSAAVPWPGIDTASNVSSKTVTFPSSDLSPGTLYCFNWNNKQAITLGSVGQQDNAGITTKTAGNAIIDSKIFPLYTTNNDKLTVTAFIDPLSRVADLNIEGFPDTSKTITQDQEIKITLSYRQNSNSSYPMEISSEWDQGLINDTDSYIDMLFYEDGSASSTDSGKDPIVDVANKRITWIVPEFPPSENFHQVSYKLKVRHDIPTDNTIKVSIKAFGRFVNSPLPERSINYSVKRSFPGITPESINTVPLKFTHIDLDEVANTYFSINFQTSRPTSFTLLYGDTPTELKQKISGLDLETLHKVKIANLLPNTQYYFKIVARDQLGNIITSDLYTVTTASEKETITLNRDDFTVFWRKYFLLSQAVNTVVIPQNKPITVTARIGDSANFFKIIALFKNDKVLGINNIDPEANVEETPLVEILPGISSGEIQAPSKKGVYTINFGLTDVRGGIYTKSAPYKFYVSDPLRVIDKKTKRPIENATVKILKYEEGLKQFTPLSNSFAIQSQTDEKGELDVVLPTGVYSIQVESPRYKSAQKTVELGISSLDYPTFELEEDNSIVGQLRYYKEEIAKFTNITSLTIRDFFSSPNNKDLFLVFSIVFLMFLVLLNLHLRKKSGMVDRVVSFSILDVLEFVTVLFGLLFIKFLGFGQTKDLALSTLFIFSLG